MTTSPPDRSMTVRAALLAELRHGPITARELSARVRIPERDVAEHLTHIERSLHKGKEPLCTEPPSCLSCGFVFRKRERLTRPGSCPKCRGTHIEAPRFWIESRAQERSRRDDDLPGDSDGDSDGSHGGDGGGGGGGPGEESGD